MELLSNVNIRFSRFVHVFRSERHRSIALYHSLDVKVMFLDPSFGQVVDFLRKGTTLRHLISNIDLHNQETFIECIVVMFEKGFVVDVRNNDMDLLAEKRRACVIPPGIISLYLVLTDLCNLKCGYCFVNNNMPTD